VGDVGGHLLETAGVEQPVDALAGGQFPFGVLFLYRCGATALADGLAAAEQFLVEVVCGHGASLKCVGERVPRIGETHVSSQ